MENAQPTQNILLQQSSTKNLFASNEPSNEIGSKQIRQSQRWLLAGCLNKISSRNSAALSLHDSSCCDLCSCWHSSLQYRTRSQSLHFFNLMSSTSATPQEAQHIIISTASTSPLLIVYLYYNIIAGAVTAIYGAAQLPYVTPSRHSYGW